MNKTLVVHLDIEGTVVSIQRGTIPQYLRTAIPDWVVERVSYLKMAGECKDYPNLAGRKINDFMVTLYIDTAEEKQIGNLIVKYGAL